MEGTKGTYWYVLQKRNDATMEIADFGGFSVTDLGFTEQQWDALDESRRETELQRTVEGRISGWFRHFTPFIGWRVGE